MPHIIIKLQPGPSCEQKSELAEKIVENVANIANCDKKVVSVSIEEVSPEDWYKKVYLPDIQKKENQLIIKPGYGPLNES